MKTKNTQPRTTTTYTNNSHPSVLLQLVLLRSIDHALLSSPDTPFPRRRCQRKDPNHYANDTKTVFYLVYLRGVCYIGRNGDGLPTRAVQCSRLQLGQSGIPISTAKCNSAAGPSHRKFTSGWALPLRRQRQAGMLEVSK